MTCAAGPAEASRDATFVLQVGAALVVVVVVDDADVFAVTEVVGVVEVGSVVEVEVAIARARACVDRPARAAPGRAGPVPQAPRESPSTMANGTTRTGFGLIGWMRCSATEAIGIS
jgi:hypothetical protein